MLTQREIIEQIFKNVTDPFLAPQLANDYKKLIEFIDTSLVQAYKLNGDERAGFLVKSFLNIRDFISSEIITENAKKIVVGSIENNINEKFREEVTKAEEGARKKQEELPTEDI